MVGFAVVGVVGVAVVGDTEGLDVGSMLGCVGDVEGCNVGSMVGIVGALVGAVVGDRVRIICDVLLHGPQYSLCGIVFGSIGLFA